MNLAAILTGLALGAAQPAELTEEQLLEQAISQQLSDQGHQVLQVEMRRQDENALTGFADIRDREGHEGRLGCVARLTEADNYSFDCLPMITDEIVREMEGQIRTTLSQQAQVLRIQLTRQDDMRMVGYALLRDSDGRQVRTSCTATREAPNSRMFNWECAPQ